MHHIREEILKSIADGRIVENESHIKLSDSGKFFADGIAASLFFLQEKKSN
jgi:coproporphyrinogen III oxidase-like Fe-S oxidoreductase